MASKTNATSKGGWSRVNPRTFYPPAILVVIITVIGALFPEATGEAMNAALAWCEKYMGWFYVLGCTLLVVFCVWLCFSKYGKIRFGGKEAKPETSFWKWFALVLTSGMAAGICYWCIAEPVSFFQNPPVFAGYEGGTAVAAENTLRYNFLHWTLHPYAIYTAAGVGISFMYWNAKRPFSISSALYPLVGEKANGNMQFWINALCIFCIVAGMGTTLGLGIDQIATGIQYVTGIVVDPNLLGLIVCLGFAAVAIIVAISGLEKGVAFVGSLNMWLFVALLVFVFFFGGTLFIVNNTIGSIGSYFQFLIGQSLYLEAAQDSGWVGGWTVFYYAWWLAFAPLIGLFQVKLAKGRTVREYVLVNMFVPCIFLALWFGTFGSSAIEMILNGNTAVPESMAEWGTSVAFFSFVQQLPLAPVLIVAGFVTIILSIITQTESQILTISDLCVAGPDDDAASDLHSPAPLKVFWGLAMSLIALILLIAGGLSAVQTASVVLGLPTLALILVMTVGSIKGFKHYKLYDKTLAPGEDYEEQGANDEDYMIGDDGKIVLKPEAAAMTE